MAKKFRTDEIPEGNFTEDWGGSSQNTVPTEASETNLLPYSGKAIQNFVKKYLKDHEQNKVGYIPPMSKDADGFYHIRAFANKTTYNEWLSDKDEYQDLMLLDVTIPISDEQGVMNIVELTTQSNQQNFVSIDGNVILKMRFTSQTYNPVTQKYSDTYEDGTLTIQRRTSSSDSWRTVGTLNIKSVEASSDTYTDVDISSLLNSGTCQLRVIVTGDQTQSTTTYVVFQSVTKTELSLVFRNEWQQPIVGSSMALLYTYSGAVAKTLNLKISGDGGTRSFKFSLGKTEYTETPNQFDITDSDNDSVKILSHGVHEIEAWLSVDGTTSESEHITSQVMVVADSSDMTPYLIINNATKSLVNWTTVTWFQWALYNPSGKSIPVTFRLTDIEGTEDYFAYTEQKVESETVYTFSNMVEIDSKDTEFSAYMLFTSNDITLHDKLSFEIDNSQNFAPTDGADLIINPKLRSNNEENPATIINAATGTEIPATFTNFGFVSDGWITDNDGIKCLYVPSGREIVIDYETFSDFMQTRKTSSLTFEFDYKVKNITDTEAAVLRMCSYTDDNRPMGFEMQALSACLMTTNKATRLDQNIDWDEDVRTHVSVNLLYNLSSSGQNYCRIFVNGIINREFNYATDDTFVQYVDGKQTSQGIRIGAVGADICIYGLKVWKRALTVSDIMQNTVAAMDSSSDKLAFRAANDILSGSLINYDLCFDKYNTILWKGKYAKYGNTKSDKFTGNLVIHIPGDPAHSGTLYNMSEKGQGTSSMLYFWWNGQWGFLEDGCFIDENGVNHGPIYQLMDGVPWATKLVGKVNFASSMQSHKPGATALYNDLWKEVCGGNSVTATEGFENCRAAVIEKPFLFFIQEDENSEPQFASFMTFGPGKGDKPTFGYDKKIFPDYICIEGADNDRNLVMCRVPWIDEDVVLDDEDWKYNNEKSWSLVFGDTSKVTPFKDAFNFVFQHFDDIEYYNGTLEDLNADTKADTSKHYWLTKAGDNNAKYDLFRYDFITNQWVGAGLEKLDEGRYSTVNINTQCGNIASGTDWAAQNTVFKAARTSLFKEGVGNYFNITETMFTMNFCKLEAASDNRGKNMYCYIDPVTHLIGWYQDDLDTIRRVDNVGKNKKPYYVEEHDLDETGSCYWNSESNALFNQMENAFPSELRTNMKAILQAMVKLSDDGTLMGCMEKYYFSIQRYLPAVAYNEVARLVYEKARTAYISTGDDKYSNGTDPITQSLGDQLQSELQWVRNRLAYISSYASFGEFGCRDGEGSSGSLNFRSIMKVDGTRPSYKFSIVPHIWMYPTFAIGQVLHYGEGNSVAPRIKAGENYDVNIGTSDGNTNVFLNGIDYMREIGDFTDKSLGETFNLSGSRLTKFYVDGKDEVQFRPTGMTVTAALLQELVVRNVGTLIGGLDLSNLSKLRLLDFTGCSLSSITFPTTEYLEEINLPATLTSLALDQQPNLQTITLEGASRLQSLSLGSGVPDSRTIFNLCFTGNAPLSYLRLSEVNWDNLTLYMINYLASITDSYVTGSLNLIKNTTNRPTFANKVQWLHQWGNVDSEDNPLHITYYENAIASISITGSQYIYETGEHKFYVKPNNTNANDVTDIHWELETNLYSKILCFEKDYCIIDVSQLGDEDTIAPHAILKCYLTKKDGTVLEASWEIGLYPRRAHLRDYVFADGTYGPTKSGKTIVGVCFYINPTDANDRRMVAVQNLNSSVWGIYPNDLSGITLQDDPSYNVYDIPTINNITTNGLSNNYITADNYLDENSQDGFVNTAITTAIGDGIAAPGTTNTGKEALTAELAMLTKGYKAGDEVPVGMAKTLKIIQHRNHILTDSGVNLEVPQATDTATEASVLESLITQVIADNGNASKYQQFYYPAASRCYAYQPAVPESETLSEKFKAHNWYLPSLGEIARLYWYSYKADSYDDDKIGPIFQQAIVDGVFTKMTASNHWSSSDWSSSNAWNVNFNNGYFITYGKYGSAVVRAVAAF